MQPARSLVCFSLLLLACPSSGGGAIDTDTDADTGGELTTGGPGPVTTAPMTTAMETTGADDTTTDVDPDSSSGTPQPECTDARECDNGDACDGAEDCVDGSCVPGQALECADTTDCTVDGCDPKLGCTFTPSNERCGCGETCDPKLGCGDYCVPATCNGQEFQCGNCIDDDGDCTIDSVDLNCFGPCDNNESGFNGKIPGQQSQSTCLTMDCYFDANSGSGNDECYWSHSCDTLEPSGCVYDPDHNTPGTGDSCDELFDVQSMTCLETCLPITPNGCDCFGCCQVIVDDATTVTVYLGTLDDTDSGSCSLEVVEDPTLCHPCTQVDGCLNTCDDCEICLGVPKLPPECEEQECPEDILPCGLPGQAPCPETFSCITGCCYPNPQ